MLESYPTLFVGKIHLWILAVVSYQRSFNEESPTFSTLEIAAFSNAKPCVSLQQTTLEKDTFSKDLVDDIAKHCKLRHLQCYL